MPSKAGKNTVHRTVAGSIAEFKRNTCSQMGLELAQGCIANAPSVQFLMNITPVIPGL